MKVNKIIGIVISLILGILLGWGVDSYSQVQAIETSNQDVTKTNRAGQSTRAGSVDGTVEWSVVKNVLHFGNPNQVEAFDNYSPHTAWQSYNTTVTEIVFDGPVKAPKISDGLFRGFTKVTSYTNMQNLDTSGVTSMTSMFAQNNSLKNIDLSNFNTANVNSMSSMFATDASLTSLDLSSFDTTNVTTMAAMFSGLTNVNGITFSNKFNTSNVTVMRNMFLGDAKLTSLDLSTFDTTKAASNRGDMLSGLSALAKLILGPKSIIMNTDLSEPLANGSYDGYQWHLSGSTNTPVYTSADLMLKYDGSAAMVGTYELVDATLAVHDTVVSQGSSWDPSMNFTSVTINGNTITDWNIAKANGVSISGAVDTNTIGKYSVTYNYGIHKSVAQVVVLPDTAITAPTSWNFGEHQIGDGSLNLPLKQVDGTTDINNNQLKITSPEANWQLNASLSDFTAPNQPNLTQTTLTIDNVELDNVKGDPVTTNIPDKLTLVAGEPTSKLFELNNIAISDRGTWTLKLGNQLSDVNLLLSNEPAIIGTQAVAYQGTVNWELVNSVA